MAGGVIEDIRYRILQGRMHISAGDMISMKEESMNQNPVLK